MRGAMCVIVRDLIVYGVLTDMMRGRPAVYATFSSYDEVAHHSGLERADTLEALRKLDEQFGRIDRARRYAPRPYEIVVLSDHGQTQGATFKQRNGYGLDELVERSLEHGTVEKVAGGDEQHSMVGLAVGEATGRPDKQKGKRAKNDVSDRDVVVLGSGNLGLISLMEEPRRLTLEEIDERHPRLIPALRAHPHVGWLLVRSSERGAGRTRLRRRPLPRRGSRRGRGSAGAVRTERASAPAAHRRVRSRGRHHGRQLLRPRPRGGLCLRGADLVPRWDRRAADAGVHPPSRRAPAPRRGRSSARRQVHGVLSGWRQQLQGGTQAGRPRLAMNLVWPALVVAAAVAVAVAAMLLVRRGAPEGSRFTDGDRASGVFGVLATGFSVLLGLRRLPRLRELRPVAIGGGDRKRSCCRSRSRPPSSWVPPVDRELTGELVCYGRSVVYGEWPRMESGTQGDAINPWGVELFRTFKTIRAARRRARKRPTESGWTRPRIAKRPGSTGSTGPSASSRRRCGWCCSSSPSWSSCSCCSSPTASEGAVTQAVLMGSVATVVVSMLLLIGFLDSPFHEGVGGVRPVAMERTLRIIDEALRRRRCARRGALRRDAGIRPHDACAQAGLGRGRGHGPARVSPPSRRPGAAIRPRAGTASRRRRRAA